jgi:Ca2+-binding RTX toxin-like protein
MVGGDGQDTLRGASGGGDFDFLYGNLGDDTFYVDTPADLVFEQSGEGANDTVFANIVGAGYYLYANIETLILEGETPFGVGNSSDNTLIGNAIGNYLLGGAGNDILNGGLGGDVLFGEVGADTFVFGVGTGGDVIGDFAAGTDRIDLSAFFSSFAEAQANFIQNGNVGAINLGNGDLVVLHNVTMNQLAATDFIFG